MCIYLCVYIMNYNLFYTIRYFQLSCVKVPDTRVQFSSRLLKGKLVYNYWDGSVIQVNFLVILPCVNGPSKRILHTVFVFSTVRVVFILLKIFELSYMRRRRLFSTLKLRRRLGLNGRRNRRLRDRFGLVNHVRSVTAQNPSTCRVIGFPRYFVITPVRHPPNAFSGILRYFPSVNARLPATLLPSPYPHDRDPDGRVYAPLPSACRSKSRYTSNFPIRIMASRLRAGLANGITAPNGLCCHGEFQTIRDRIRRTSGRLAESVAGSIYREGIYGRVGRERDEEET